ncbi:MAG: methyltransferase domain-containing protein [Pseudomonadota bacterium]
MHLDVRELREFYEEDPLGALVKRRLQTALREVWPSARGCSIAGYGYAAPILPLFRAEATRALALMPAQQGAAVWPRAGANAAALVEAYDWPVQTGFLDRLVLAHALENTAQPDRLLDECWRCLAPEGRMVVIAPNRAGLWARRDGTPFGHGRPYSFAQLEAQLEAHGFGLAQRLGALYFAPSHRRTWMNAALLVERIGRRLDWQRLAGVLMVEAVKRVPAPRPGLKERAGSPLEALAGVVAPRPAPAPGRLG